MATARTNDADEERQVWDLLTREFDWRVPETFPIKVHSAAGVPIDQARLQIFEVVVATMFAQLRPQYEWSVTPSGPDQGLDFLGRYQLLFDESLGISAAITVGGQCKKRTTFGSVLDVIGGSLITMGAAHKPTFFIVALSARVSPERVREAEAAIRSELNRHCHILDRDQLESLIGEQTTALEDVLPQALKPHEVDRVLRYFLEVPARKSSHSIDVRSPDDAYSGVPFRVTAMVRSPLISSGRARIRWEPPTTDDSAGRVALIGPVGADSPAGAVLMPDESSGNPTTARCDLEFLTFASGPAALGQLLVGRYVADQFTVLGRETVNDFQVIPTFRPRFFDQPFFPALRQLDREFTEAKALGVSTIAVVGTGGSGKSRLCQEFCLEKRRRGAEIITARQANTFNNPHRIFAKLLEGLAEEEQSPRDPAASVITSVARYDPLLAIQASSSIRSVVGGGAGRDVQTVDQDVIAAILVLLVARRRRASVIVHLQDLHWCTPEGLHMIERLLWQLAAATKDGAAERSGNRGVLFILEGRTGEQQDGDSSGHWKSDRLEKSVNDRLEDFIDLLRCPRVQCSDLSNKDGWQFISRLFEDPDRKSGRVGERFHGLERELVGRIHRASGGNPFHSLEHVRMLTDQGHLAQSPADGTLYLIKPEPIDEVLPPSVFESIRRRWRYLRTRSPTLALLVWAVALLDDHVEAPLFRRLRSELAPDYAARDVDATDLLWTGDSDTSDVVFRHENYFEAIRRFGVAPAERERVVDIYSAWFGSLAAPGPIDTFRWGRVLLERQAPDIRDAQRLFRQALKAARRRGDTSLARSVATTLVDLAWRHGLPDAARGDVFLRHCDDDLALIGELLGSDRAHASRRLDRLQPVLDRRRALTTSGKRLAVELERRSLIAEVLRSELLFNDREPARAAVFAGDVVARVRRWRSYSTADERDAWMHLEIDALHSYAVALALAGEIDRALATSEQAVALTTEVPTLDALKVVSTHANILLARDPAQSEALLRMCTDRLAADHQHGNGDRNDIKINLAMTLVVRAHVEGVNVATRLDEAAGLLHTVFDAANRRGDHPDAGAAALLLGIVAALRGEPADVSWFGQAVVSAAHGRQMETLWRAQINCATAIYRRHAGVTPAVRDRAHAALSLMEETLASYAAPDQSPRFRLLAVPLAQAVRFLVLAGDDAGITALERYPALRRCFQDPVRGILADDRGGHYSHEWLRLGDEDYVIY